MKIDEVDIWRGRSLPIRDDEEVAKMFVVWNGLRTSTANPIKNVRIEYV